ncbi:MAG: AAA family ATPase [Saprospiraceae bacterium]|nr:AAA family ATPase [Lewinella sp.]
MRIGFTFGKYLPFHKGHQALIDFALGRLDVLYVIVCASERETIPVAVRSKWIRDIFPEESRLQIMELVYSEEILPNTSVSSREVSKVWAEHFKQLLPLVNAVVTSEPYGNFVAEYMDIQHISFDLDRGQVPISASCIRQRVYDHWDYLPDPVKAYYQKKVVFLGTESTGKSSIAAALAERLPAVLVPEMGRDLIADSNHFTPDLLEKVALTHAWEIEKSLIVLTPLVLIDTNVHITQSYARSRFSNYLKLPAKVYEQNRADLYLYLTADLPFEQDGTRLEENDRNALDDSHRQTLADFGVAYVEVGGNWRERMEKCEAIIRDCFDLR